MRIRLAKVDDASAISIVHINSWRSSYRGIVPDQVLDSLDYVRNGSRWREMLSNLGEMKCFFVAEDDDGRIIGFAIGGPNREEKTGFNGELYAIYLLKEYQGKGVGKKLVENVAYWLSRHKYNSMLVWVLEKNPAKYFYESLGARPVGRKKIEIGNAPLDELSYGWPDLSILIPNKSK
ncbi:MAG TPA: GNAT family N-acetyltransferase [candidate division Zixibacteria bacterium]|jgi:GNAT superfamily N-acetyltransferase|nr:GNAT family N-acetyltransferase [candidate division Zixibacteria bacterium]HBZ01570.1 GNAT family N-acetyltransferase [candidate division Zixibacteria bacterium]